MHLSNPKSPTPVLRRIVSSLFKLFSDLAKFRVNRNKHIEEEIRSKQKMLGWSADKKTDFKSIPMKIFPFPSLAFKQHGTLSSEVQRSTDRKKKSKKEPGTARNLTRQTEERRKERIYRKQGSLGAKVWRQHRGTSLNQKEGSRCRKSNLLCFRSPLWGWYWVDAWMASCVCVSINKTCIAGRDNKTHSS